MTEHETCPQCGSARIALERITADQAMFGRDASLHADWPTWDEPVNRRTCMVCWHHWDEWPLDNCPITFIAKESA